LGPGRHDEKDRQQEKANHKPDTAPQSIRIFMTMILFTRKHDITGMIF
jgi:hypothetical protein